MKNPFIILLILMVVFSFLIFEPSTAGELVYSTFIGGGGPDQGNSIAVDTAGNVYITGQTESSDFPTTAGAFDTTYQWGEISNADVEVFVTKLSPDGTILIYSTYLGGNFYRYYNGSGMDCAYSIAIDNSGCAYITGRTSSWDFPTTPNAFDNSFNGAINYLYGLYWSVMDDVFFSKLSAEGSMLLYSTYIGGSGAIGFEWDSNEAGYAIAVDDSGNAYITGYTESADFPLTPGAIDSTLPGNAGPFVCKINPSLSGSSSLIYSTCIGTGKAYNISIDSGGNALITGYTTSSTFPITANALDSTYNGSSDVFIAKINSTGTTLLYSSFLGGIGDEVGNSLARDSSGNIYLTGYTSSSTNFPITSNVVDSTYNGGTYDTFICKLNSNLSILLYSTYLGGTNDEKGNSLAVDKAGNVYVTGQTYSSDFPTTPSALDTLYNGSGDAFMSKLNTSGTALVYSSYLGGGNGDECKGIALDGSGNVYLTGETYSPDFPTTPGALDTSFNGSSDVFVIKIPAAYIPIELIDFQATIENQDAVWKKE